jgi:hypothetical protein
MRNSNLYRGIYHAAVKTLIAWERTETDWREKTKTEMPGDPLSAAYAPGGVVGESKKVKKKT